PSTAPASPPAPPTAALSAYDPVRLLVLGFVGRAAVAVVPQRRDRGLEVLQRGEPPVHARKAEVGDLVELLQRAEDRQAHLVRVDLRGTGAADRLLDLLGQPRDVVVTDGQALARLADARGDLVAAERLRCA